MTGSLSSIFLILFHRLHTIYHGHIDIHQHYIGFHFFDIGLYSFCVGIEASVSRSSSPSINASILIRNASLSSYIKTFTGIN